MTCISFSINLKLVVPTLKFFVANLQWSKWWSPWLFQYKPSLVMEETLCIVSWALAVSCDSCPFAWSSGFIHQNQLIKKKKKKLFTKKSNGCKDFKSTAISKNFMKMDIKVHDFYIPKIEATYRTVLEFNGLKYQWAWFPTPGANADWYPSLMDSTTANTVFEFHVLEYQWPWF